MSKDKKGKSKKDKKNKKEYDEEKYMFSEWGCLYVTLLEHGVDVDRISGEEGKKIINEFMKMMIAHGYIKES